MLKITYKMMTNISSLGHPENKDKWFLWLCHGHLTKLELKILNKKHRKGFAPELPYSDWSCALTQVLLLVKNYHFPLRVTKIYHSPKVKVDVRLTHRRSLLLLQRADGCSAGFLRPISAQLHSRSPLWPEQTVLSKPQTIHLYALLVQALLVFPHLYDKSVC